MDTAYTPPLSQGVAYGIVLGLLDYSRGTLEPLLTRSRLRNRVRTGDERDHLDIAKIPP